MSATTTAIWVIVIGTTGGTMRPPLPVAIRYLLRGTPGGLPHGMEQFMVQPVQVLRRVHPVEDGAAAHDHVDVPAGHLSSIADRHPAVHADQDLGARLPGQLAHLRHPLPRVR